ncbi:MAG: hypothetical protein KCHDKBKB_00597 [Elusimicrobia bacterium]|nr:hypothetical protein [Elusimicrobiota bacterium]
MPGTATPLGYCDKTDLENFLLMTIDSSFNTQVNDWIAAAENQANGFMGYTTASGIMNEAIVDEIQDGTVNSDGDLIIFPRKSPLNSISSISLIKGTSSITLTLTDSSGSPKYNIPTHSRSVLYPGYELSITGSSVITSFNDLRAGKFFTKMSYVAGYTTVPADIRLATVNYVADVLMRHTNKEALAAITQGKVSKRWQERRGGKSDFILDAEDLLQGYRLTQRWV